MINVTCAIIRNEENEILIVRRGEATDHPFKWEFPGGKTEDVETDEECIIREVKEELCMDIVICGKLPSVEYNYGIKKILLIPFLCDTLDELPFLTEHIEYKWIHANDLGSVDFSEADIIVAERYLESMNSEKNQVSNVVQESAAGPADDSELQSMITNIMGMQEADWIATSAIENPAIFLKLLEYSYSSDKKLAFRASWTLTKVCDKFPEIINPYLSQIVDSLWKTNDESTLRSFLRIISLSDLAAIKYDQHGLLADFCYSKLNSGFSAIAIKAYSMEILYRLSLIYPELVTELSASIMILMEDGSAGINARGKMILKKLAEIPVDPKPSHLLS
jgi:8-oxo-dGTP diphosphatase